MTDGTIAGVHGLRVTATWLNEDDLFPTYAGILVKHSPGGPGTDFYSGVKVDYASYADLLANAGYSGIEVTEDLTCDVSGVQIKRGRDSIGHPFVAGTLNMTLNDHDGHHDPRRPPAGPSRTGAKVVVEVDPELHSSFTPIFTGFVESWQRTVDAGDPDVNTISVTASDAFSLMARAVPVPPSIPIGAGQTGAQRMVTLFDEITWVPKWGELDITGGLVPMSSSKLDGDVLDQMHDITDSEDGIFFVRANGEIYWYDRYYIGLRLQGVCIIDVTGKLAPDAFAPVGIMCPMSYSVTDDDLDVVNRAVVWRSVDTDPDLPEGTPGHPNGGRPDVVKKSTAPLDPAHPERDPAIISISQHGLLAREYVDMPHSTDGHSQWLADRMGHKLCGEANPIGDFQFPLVKRTEDANIAARLQFGDQVIVWDAGASLSGTPEPYLFELTGVSHDITPEEWTATLFVDNWVPQKYGDWTDPMGVTPGIPGHFDPPGAISPPDFPTLFFGSALGETTAWTAGQFVWLGNKTRAHWTGTSWANGALNDPTSVTAGFPGHFNPGTAVIPINFDSLVAQGPLGSTLEWAPGTSVILGDGNRAYWGGPDEGWVKGPKPNEGRAGAPGTPGTYSPATLTRSTVASLIAVKAVPQTPWDFDTWVPLTGSQQFAHWRGDVWLQGKSPGYSDTPP